MDIALAVISWSAIVVVSVLVGRQVAKKRLLADRRRRLISWAVGAVVVWALGVMVVWPPISGVIPKAVLALLAPFSMTSWPAQRGLALAAEHGGIPKGIPAVLVTVVMAVIWAVVLWAPMLSLRSRKMPLPLGVILQVLLFAVMIVWRWA